MNLKKINFKRSKKEKKYLNISKDKASSFLFLSLLFLLSVLISGCSEQVVKHDGENLGDPSFAAPFVLAIEKGNLLRMEDDSVHEIPFKYFERDIFNFTNITLKMRRCDSQNYGVEIKDQEILPDVDAETFESSPGEIYSSELEISLKDTDLARGEYLCRLSAYGNKVRERNGTISVKDEKSQIGTSIFTLFIY